MKDQENLKAELEKQHQQHEKRLTSMAGANMMKLKKENEEALRNLRSNMERDKANIQQRNKNLQSEISRLKAELNKPRPGMYVCYILLLLGDLLPTIDPGNRKKIHHHCHAIQISGN